MGSSPLSVREILAIVLGFADPKTLQAAAQVNSLWANEATKARLSSLNSRNMELT